MAESERQRELAMRESLDEPFCPAIVELDRATPDAGAAAEAEANAANQKAEHRVW